MPATVEESGPGRRRRRAQFAVELAAQPQARQRWKEGSGDTGWIGAAREAAYFATAPFVGAIAALALLGDQLQPREATAMAVMALGVPLLTAERHQHVHTHAELKHDHLHLHDAHHRHDR